MVQEDISIIACGRRVIRLEAAAVASLEGRLDRRFAEAVKLIVDCNGKVVCSGMGKAGLIAQKVAATFASTGIPAVFIHPSEALHGDLGLVADGDVAVLFSNSGESEEVLRLLPYLKSRGVTLIAITALASSSLGRSADVVLEMGVVEEACPLRLAPSSSTTALLALGDALALTVLEMRGFTSEDYAKLHPAGSLGRSMRRVDELMRTGDRCPAVLPTTSVRDALTAITRARAGLVCIVDNERHLVGVFTDGDFRRHWSKDAAVGDRAVGEIMTSPCLYVQTGTMVRAAKKLMAEKHVNALPVVDAERRLLGLVDIQDLS
ncbi:MAG: KpsF/GutQ family sugar-phosphate isomerase [Acidobacteriota bacterium]|nr:KpsF/GutQ family sugar-phosphate isomerase [Blastocatellia bacterium]MDW8412215.1 KpsF/GutQ family sugar-phosphate isomerase [Acidobacteriota bacterium]